MTRKLFLVVIILVILVGSGYMTQRQVTTGTIAKESGDGVDYAARKPTGAVPVGPIYTSTDLAELAARTAFGVPNTFDRRGNVVWADGFESNINKWTSAVSGAGASVALSTLDAHNGVQSVRLVAGSDTLRYAYINKYFFFPVLGKVGFEAHFSWDNNIEYVSLDFYLYDGTSRLDGVIRITPDTSVVQYKDSAGVYQALTVAHRLFASATIRPWVPVKLVADYETGKFTRLLVGINSWDLSAMSMKSSAAPGDPVMQLVTQITSKAGTNAVCYVDDAIITQNEPDND